MGFFSRRPAPPPVVLPDHARQALSALQGRDQGFARACMEDLVRQSSDDETVLACALNYKPWTSIPSLWVVTDRRLYEIRKDDLKSIPLTELKAISHGRSGIDYMMVIEVCFPAGEGWSSHMNEQLYFASDEIGDAKNLHRRLSGLFQIADT